MGRIIDMDNLDADDIQYLRDRGRLPAGVEASEPTKEPKKESKQEAPPAPSVPAPEPVKVEPVSLDDKTVSQLKEMARDRELAVGGSKQDLIERITDHDSGLSSDEEVIEEEQ